MRCRIALEWSSPELSVAVDEGGKVFSRRLRVDRFRMPAAMDLVSQTLNESGCREKDITEIRVGRGPGNYTGIRQSLALAMGWSVPDRVPLRVAGSGTVLFYGPEMNRVPGWVIGDARRGEWWGAWVSGDAVEWKTSSPEEWRQKLQGKTIFSSEASRLSGLEVTPAFPRAESLFFLGESLLLEPAEPLYLHQAV